MLGTKILNKTEEIYDLFLPSEGYNSVYYGRIRNGKTYSATADIHELLNRGEVVYANWHVKFETYDERQSFFVTLLKLVTGRHLFYVYDQSNFHYLDTNSPTFITDINKLVGVHLFIDEGQWVFNSHLKTDDPEKRKLVLEGGHYCRSLNVITQRPANILKDIRSQVHIWYRVEKRISFGRFVLFARWEYQDMKEDIPDENLPVGRPKHYFASKKVFASYDTHARRSKDAQWIKPNFDVYYLTTVEKFKILIQKSKPRFLRDLVTRFSRPEISQEPALKPTKKKGYKLSDLESDR